MQVVYTRNIGGENNNPENRCAHLQTKLYCCRILYFYRTKAFCQNVSYSSQDQVTLDQLSAVWLGLQFYCLGTSHFIKSSNLNSGRVFFAYYVFIDVIQVNGIKGKRYMSDLRK